MALKGEAFLCIWNDHDPAQAAEYEAWHTFEHVPERVCVPGFLAGRRYAAYEREDSRYFTFYDIESLASLDSPAYRDLQDNPTPWSSAMRVAFRNFLRIPCKVIASQGNGCAGAIGTLAFSAARGKDDALNALLQQLAAERQAHAITTYHVGKADGIPAYGVFKLPASVSDTHDIHVVVIESQLRQNADAALARLADTVRTHFDQPHFLKQESGQFLFAIENDELVGSPLRRTGDTPPETSPATGN